MLTGALVQDVLKCNDKELRVLAEVKFHPGLKQAFDEAGISATEAGPYVGTPESVTAAVKRNGSPERLHYIIRTLAGAGLGRWLIHCASNAPCLHESKGCHFFCSCILIGKG